MRLTSFLAVSAVAAGLALAPASGAQAKQKLLYGGFLPTSHVGNAVLADVFDRINAGSEDMEWEMHVGGAMAGAKDILANVRDGILHAGHIVDVYAPSDLPTSVVIAQLALVALDNLAATGAVNELMLLNCESCQEEFARNNVVPLAFYATTPQVLMCNEEVARLGDLDGKKVRSVGPIGVLYKSLGAVPVNTAMTELYDGLQRGQVNCASGAAAWLKDIKLWEVVKHVYDYDVATYTTSHIFNMNKETWDALSPSDRKLIGDNLADIAAGWAMVYYNEKVVANRMAKNKGLNYHQMPADIVQAIETYRGNEPTRAADWGKSKGVEDAQAIVDTYLRLLDKWEKIVAETGPDPERYADALRREIFDKVKF